MNAAVADRVLPHSLEAERAVLGAVLVNPEMFFEARVLTPGDFHRVGHGCIWDALRRLVAKNAVIDYLTLKHELEAAGDLDEAGGPAYLAALIDGVPRSSHIEAYARIVQRKSRRRAIAAVARQMLVDALEDDDEDEEDALDRAHRQLLGLHETGGRRGLVPASELVAKVQPLIERILERKSPVLGVSTGFIDLDQQTRGMRAGELIILAGRPSMGKSSLAGNIAENVASAGQPIAVYSVEMRDEDVTLRVLAARARLDFHSFMTGHLSTSQLAKLSQAMAEVSQIPLHIDDAAETTLLDIRAEARRLKFQSGLALIIIDYLQLMRAPDAENRNLAIGEISRGLKGIAKELDLPVLALSQLSRAPEHRADKRPMLSDLRESGNLEQDADQVWFVHRPEMYGVTDENRGKAELIIAKARNGPTGTVPLTWLAHQMRFADAAAQSDGRVEPRLL